MPGEPTFSQMLSNVDMSMDRMTKILIDSLKQPNKPIEVLYKGTIAGESDCRRRAKLHSLLAMKTGNCPKHYQWIRSCCLVALCGKTRRTEL